MKLADALRIPIEIKSFICIGGWPTLKAVFRNPVLLFKPTALSREFMFHVWSVYGDGLDEGPGGRNAVKQGLLTPYASGIVLEIGAGYGHTAHYLDHEKVTKFVAVEPNTLMHEHIREHASKAGFNESDGTLVILPYGAEETSSIFSAIGGTKVDTIIAIRVLCSVPSPETTINAVVHDLLSSGGQLLYFEHVLSDLPDVAWWQRLWAPLWQIVGDGCRLDRPTHVWIDKLGVREINGVWEEGRMWSPENEPEMNLFWHRVGRYVKR